MKRTDMRKQTQDMMHRIKRLPGYDAKVSRGGGHWHITDATGRLLVVAPRTPSDWRSLKNTTAQLKRAGVPVGKTEFDAHIEREDMRTKEERKPGVLPESQARLVAELNVYLASHPQFKTGAKTGARAKFARDAMAAVPEGTLRRPKNASSLEQAIHRLVNVGGSVSPWTEDFLWAALEKLQSKNGKVEETEVEQEGFTLASIDQALEEAEAEGLVERVEVPDEVEAESDALVEEDAVPFTRSTPVDEAGPLLTKLLEPDTLPLRMLAALLRKKPLTEDEAIALIVEMQSRMK